ncbi:MAG: tRNA uridine-5-carboxymethylaminomethyl(34) synthesis GTPase MnmE [Bacilli bacterium]
MDDTITAIGTMVGEASISIIRISGDKSLDIIDKIFSKKSKSFESHSINYGFIKSNDTIVDEVLVSYMKAPKTFTGEDVIEINCHGGVLITNKILELVLKNGARMAQPGEFSKRAFLNGKMDLIKAESIMDMISATSEKALKISTKGLTNKISNSINNLREELVQILGTIEVNIDYPEYDDVDVMTNQLLLPKIQKIKTDLEKIIKNSKSVNLAKKGIDVALIGEPNVGKSSLLNALVDEEKAIVTDIAGTTRDIIEGSVLIDGLRLNILDTAGIRKTDNLIEKIGIEKSIEISKKADLIIYMLDNTVNNTKEALDFIENNLYKKVILVVNKTDLENSLDKSIIEKYNPIYISAKDNIKIEKLKTKISETFRMDFLESEDAFYVTNINNLVKLKECLTLTESVIGQIYSNDFIDMIAIDIRKIWYILGSITGEVYDGELLDNIFKNFCLGK